MRVFSFPLERARRSTSTSHPSSVLCDNGQCPSHHPRRGRSRREPGKLRASTWIMVTSAERGAEDLASQTEHIPQSANPRSSGTTPLSDRLGARPDCRGGQPLRLGPRPVRPHRSQARRSVWGQKPWRSPPVLTVRTVGSLPVSKAWWRHTLAHVSQPPPPGSLPLPPKTACRAPGHATFRNDGRDIGHLPPSSTHVVGSDGASAGIERCARCRRHSQAPSQSPDRLWRFMRLGLPARRVGSAGW